jgi:hypothetical protein
MGKSSSLDMWIMTKSSPKCWVSSSVNQRPRQDSNLQPSDPKVEDSLSARQNWVCWRGWNPHLGVLCLLGYTGITESTRITHRMGYWSGGSPAGRQGFMALIKIHPFRFSISNPSCYLTRRLMEQANTKRATLNSKPAAVTAWICFGSNCSTKLPVVSTNLR